MDRQQIFRRATQVLLIGMFAALAVACSRSAATDSSTPPMVSKTAWVQGGGYRLKVSINTGSRVNGEPVLLVVLHGDLGTGTQDALAARAAADSDVIGVGLLRPGYTDSMGNTSDGQKGPTTSDNYNAQNTDAIAAAVLELKREFHPRKTVLASHSGGGGHHSEHSGKASRDRRRCITDLLPL